MQTAALFDRSEVEALGYLATTTEPFGEGVLAYSAPGSRSNKAAGFGLARPLDEETLARIESFYGARSEPARIELTSFASSETLRLVGARGFVLHEILSVLVRPTAEPLSAPPVAIHRVDPSDEAALEAFVALSMSGFFAEGESVPASTMEIGLRGARHPGNDGFVATIDGAPVGAAGCGSNGGLTVLFGASVIPSHRRRGIQRALIAKRLERANERGSLLAAIVSNPGESTERNALRLGFRLSHMRLSFVKSALPR